MTSSSSSSSATFLFGPNYDTHVPNRNVSSIVGVEEGAGMTGGGQRARRSMGAAMDFGGEGGEATAAEIAFDGIGRGGGGSERDGGGGRGRAAADGMVVRGGSSVRGGGGDLSGGASGGGGGEGH